MLIMNKLIRIKPIILVLLFAINISAWAEKKVKKIDLNQEQDVSSHAATTPTLATTIASDKRKNDESQVVNQQQEIIIDSVLASVDGIPITLREFTDQLNPKRKVAISDFTKDPSLGQFLDAMIMERLIEAESTNRKIKATSEDVDRYIEQVASQNNLSRSDFEVALKTQNKSMEDFKKQARLEILRSRLMGQIAQSAPAVTDQELDESVDTGSDSALLESDHKVRFKLREIVILKKSEQDESISEKAQNVYEKLSEGEDFSKLAKEVSQGASAQNGGDLGEVVEDDLSDEIKENVSNLEVGKFSQVIEMSDAYRLFYLEARYEEGETSTASSQNKEQLRKELENHKLETKFQEFFTVELPKLHKVDRKV